MSERLKELLEKINQEGVKQAEEKAKDIESKARDEAARLLEDAKNQAEKIVEAAKKDAEKTKQIGEIALRQSARDLMLSLKDEIKKVFDKIITAEIGKAMSHEEITVVLRNLIEKYVERNGESSDIKVLLKKEDLEKLKSSFILKLKERFKDGIDFKPSPNINAGFSISFDKGRSYFDFSDEGLTEALCAYLNPELAKLLKG